MIDADSDADSLYKHANFMAIEIATGLKRARQKGTLHACTCRLLHNAE